MVPPAVLPGYDRWVTQVPEPQVVGLCDECGEEVRAGDRVLRDASGYLLCGEPCALRRMVRDGQLQWVIAGEDD